MRNKINKAMVSKSVVDLQQPMTTDSTEIPAYVPTSKVCKINFKAFILTLIKVELHQCESIDKEKRNV